MSVLPPRLSYAIGRLSWTMGRGFAHESWIAVLPEALRDRYTVKLHQNFDGSFMVLIWQDRHLQVDPANDLSSLQEAKAVAEAAIAALLRREQPESAYR